MKLPQRILVFLIGFSLLSCYASEYKKPDLSELNAILAVGKSIDLNQQQPDKDQSLLVRIHELPIFENDCFVETHGICQNQYYISVSTFDEYPETNVFKLNHIGSLVTVNWLKESELDHAKISLVLDKYTDEALKNNPALKNQKIKLIVRLGINDMEVTRE